MRLRQSNYSLPTSTTLNQYINYETIQQIKIKNIQSQSNQQNNLIQYKKQNNIITILTQDNQNLYLRFYPYKNYIHHKKIIHKQKNKILIKYYQKNIYHKFIKKLPNIQFKINNYKDRQITIQIIFEWMMEFAHYLKISKNAYFRAITIFQRAIHADNTIISNNMIPQYACAALSIGSKYQKSYGKYIDQIFKLYSRRISKIQLIKAQNNILDVIKWRIPVHIMIEEELTQILQLWTRYLNHHRSQFEHIYFFRCFDGNNLISKLYVEIVCVLDYLIIKRSYQWLKQQFEQPILISLYILFSINAGDIGLDQFCLWSHFQQFLKQTKLIIYIDKLKIQITKCVQQYNILEILRRIPLDLNFNKIIEKKYQQFYIPKINQN